MIRLAVRVMVGLGVLLVASGAVAQPRGSTTADDQWTFLQAWTVFRRDVDATVPGAHGEVLLADLLEGAPDWVLRDAIRVAASPDVIGQVARRLARGGDRAAIPSLRSALQSAPDETSQRALERALVQLGDAELRGAMAKRLRAASGPARWHAAVTLAASGKAAMPHLRAALSDPDGHTRLVAATALAERGDGAARRLLGKLLGSTNPFERREAAIGLARANDRKAVPILRELLRQPGPDRGRAAVALGQVGSLEDEALLLEVFRSIPRGASLAAQRSILIALGRITLRRRGSKGLRSAVSALDEDVDDMWGQRAQWLEALGRAVVAGAEDQASLSAKVAKSLTSARAGETPVAFQRRKRLVAPLADHLAGKKAVSSAAAPPPANLGVLRKAISTKGGDGAVRTDRFRSALRILDILGSRLGHGALSEPPSPARAVGLGADRAIDGNLHTSWMAGTLAGPLRLELSKGRRISHVLIVNGCVTSRGAYRDHPRVKTVRVTTKGGVVEATLSDSHPYFQRVKAAPGPPSKSVKLEVVAVYPGRGRGAKAPACIPEIRLQ